LQKIIRLLIIIDSKYLIALQHNYTTNLFLVLDILPSTNLYNYVLRITSFTIFGNPIYKALVQICQKAKDAVSIIIYQWPWAPFLLLLLPPFTWKNPLLLEYWMINS
jgi:hypothetical protein